MNISIDRCLRKNDRRKLLYYMEDKNEINIIDIVIYLENNTDIQKPKITLCHISLPLLNDANIIEWNKQSNIIRKDKRFEEALEELNNRNY